MLNSNVCRVHATTNLQNLCSQLYLLYELRQYWGTNFCIPCIQYLYLAPIAGQRNLLEDNVFLQQHIVNNITSSTHGVVPAGEFTGQQ